MDTKVAANRYGKRMQPKPGRMTENKPRISEVHILWITGRARLRRRHGVDHRGQPAQHRRRHARRHSGAAQGASAQPRACLCRSATNSWRPFTGRRAASSTPFVLVIEGSIPNEKLKGNGYWAAFGTDPKTGQPITDLRVARPAGAQGAGRRRRRHLRGLWRHPCHGRQSDRLHGGGRLSRLELEIEGRSADRQRPGLPGPT